MTDQELQERVAVFVDAGLLDRVPTRVQVLQGELDMWSTVLSTDVTDEARYQGATLGHPWLRQPLIFAEIGLDHLRVGTGLGSRRASVCAHLCFTWHRGMPVWDLQVLQTHPGGLDALEARIDGLLTPATRADARARRRLGWILPDPDAYLRRFLGTDGWIARASRHDYTTAAEEGDVIPEAFHSLVGFLAWSAETFPTHVPAHRWPGHAARLATRRFREGRGFGWFLEGAA